MVHYLTTFCAFFLMVTMLHSAEMPNLEKDPLLQYVSHDHDPKVYVDTLRVVDPETFKQEVFYTTRISNLKTECESDKKMNFALTSLISRSNDIESIASNFRDHLLQKGYISSGDAQVILKRDKLTIGGVDKPSRMHGEVLKHFRQSLGDFHEVSLRVF